MKKAIMLLITFSLLVVVGCGSGSDDGNEESQNDSSVVTEPSGETTESDEPADSTSGDMTEPPDESPEPDPADALGRIRIQIDASPDYYYILYVRDDLPGNSEWAVSMALGEAGSITLTEQLAAWPLENYRVVQYRRDDPADTDGDGIDDMREFSNLGRMSPFNPAPEVDIRDGVVAIPDRAVFEEISYKGTDVLIDRHLEDLEFIKFYILDADTENPQVYFQNTVRHRSHMSFSSAIGMEGGMGGGFRPGGGSSSGQMRGEIVYHPNVVAPSGQPGVYRFEFEPNDSFPFETVRMAYELLAAHMPVLKNNLAYYPMPNAALPLYYDEKEKYDASRVAILLEEDIYAEVGYLALNIAQGYGLLRHMSIEERPNSRDIVIYEALPNEMSRVGGIITTVPQTPLSHVNLRAIQEYRTMFPMPILRMPCKTGAFTISGKR